MEVHIISFAPAQIPHLGKFWFLSYEPKWSLVVGFLNQLYLKKKMMNHFDFWHAEIDSGNVKSGL